MSLERFWDCFWSDDAPYFIPAIIRDPEDTFTSTTAWYDNPSPGFEVMNLGDGNMNVIKERYIEKTIRIRAPFAPDYSRN